MARGCAEEHPAVEVSTAVRDLAAVVLTATHCLSARPQCAWGLNWVRRRSCRARFSWRCAVSQTALPMATTEPMNGTMTAKPMSAMASGRAGIIGKA